MYSFTFLFVKRPISCADNDRKSYINIAKHNISYGVATFSTFLQSELVK